jgi:hypothetical protein
LTAPRPAWLTFLLWFFIVHAAVTLLPSETVTSRWIDWPEETLGRGTGWLGLVERTRTFPWLPLEVLVGEAMDQGPVMLSWHDVREAGTRFEDGYNVVIHEFAHKLDLRDGQADGCPPLGSRAARHAWLQVLARAYEAFREQVIVAERFGGEPTWLDPYGAQAIDEFFAVACEGYFVQRERFAREFADLVPLFDSFFKPAARP